MIPSALNFRYWAQKHSLYCKNKKGQFNGFTELSYLPYLYCTYNKLLVKSQFIALLLQPGFLVQLTVLFHPA